MTTTLSWGERIRTLRSRMKLDQDAMGAEIGLSREWVSKLETGKEEPSERVRLKVEKIEREQVHKSESQFKHLNLGGLAGAAVHEPRAKYQTVASRLPQQRSPATRDDCEAYARQLFDAAEISADPNAWPVILHRLKKQFPLDEWEPGEPEKETS